MASEKKNWENKVSGNEQQGFAQDLLDIAKNLSRLANSLGPVDTGSNLRSDPEKPKLETIAQKMYQTVELIENGSTLPSASATILGTFSDSITYIKNLATQVDVGGEKNSIYTSVLSLYANDRGGKTTLKTTENFKDALNEVATLYQTMVEKYPAQRKQQGGIT